MKQLLLSASFVLVFAGVTAAQSNGHKKAASHSGSTARSLRTKKSTASKGADTADQRKNYNWNTGQTATPTGNEATGTNGSAAPKKASTTKPNN